MTKRSPRRQYIFTPAIPVKLSHILQLSSVIKTARTLPLSTVCQEQSDEKNPPRKEQRRRRRGMHKNAFGVNTRNDLHSHIHTPNLLCQQQQPTTVLFIYFCFHRFSPGVNETKTTDNFSQVFKPTRIDNCCGRRVCGGCCIQTLCQDLAYSNISRAFEREVMFVVVAVYLRNCCFVFLCFSFRYKLAAYNIASELRSYLTVSIKVFHTLLTVFSFDKMI